MDIFERAAEEALEAEGIEVVLPAEPPSNGHGGRRPGAGAPRGNKNRVTHGRSSRDARFRAWWGTLEPQQQEGLKPFLLAHEADILEFDPLPDGVGEPGDPSSTSHQYIHTQRQQSNNQTPIDTHGPAQTHTSGMSITARREALIEDMRDLSDIDPEAFIDRHYPELERIEVLVASTRRKRREDPVFTPGAGWVRNQIHLAIYEQVGRYWACRWCPWTQERLLK